MTEERSSSTTVLLAFAGGALLGAGVALLFAPRSGRKTRQELADMAEETLDKAHDLGRDAARTVEEARHRGEQWVGKAKSFVEEKKAEVESILDGARR